MTADAATPRPMLRGWTHAIAVPAAAGGGVALVIAGRGDAARQVSLAVYGTALTLLFTVSALYHRGPWTPRVRGIWRRLDHATIFVAIAGTYTPIVVNLLQGWTRVALLLIVWALAVCGVVVAAGGIDLPRLATAGLYFGVGCTVIAFLPALLGRVDGLGLLTLAAGGGLYAAGAAIYVARRPRLWPSVFSYHEVFHLFVIAASAIFFAFITVYVVARAH